MAYYFLYVSYPNKKRLYKVVHFSPLLGFSQGIDYQPDLSRCEATGGIRKTNGTEIVHQVRIVIDPQHEFLAGSSGSDIRAVELCQLSFAIRTNFHQL